MIKDFFLTRPITVIEDLAVHRRILLHGLLAAILYSIVYGIYEYFVVYNGLRLIDRLGPIINWTIMWLGLIITVALVTRFNIQNTIMGL